MIESTAPFPIPPRDAAWEERMAIAAEKVAAYFEKHKNEILLPHKYYPALEHFIGNHLEKRFNENPDIPLKDVLAIEMQALDPRIPAEKIIELATFTIKKWQAIQNKAEAPTQKPRAKAGRKKALAEAVAA